MSVDLSAHALLTTCRCIAINCSRCGEPFTDEEWEAPQCFESIAQAIKALAEADWDISDDEVTCPKCAAGTAGMKSLAICEYCSPPLRPLVDGKPEQAPFDADGDITVRRVGKKTAGRVLDGREWDEFPQPLSATTAAATTTIALRAAARRSSRRAPRRAVSAHTFRID